MPDVHPVDLVAAIIIGVASVRGLFNGMIREVFSVLALAAAVVAVRVWNEPFAEWIYPLVRGQINSTTVPWIAGAVIGVGVVVAVGIFGAVMSRGAKAVGLGWADRAGGVVLGFAEGALVVGILLAVIGGFLGRDSATLANSRSLALLEQAEAFASRGASAPPPAPGDVAAPGPAKD
jgi:membrane protein required for colicin V production